MAKRKPPTEAGDWQPSELDIKWCNARYPTMDIERTAEAFLLNAESHGRLYASWSAAFKNWCLDRNGYGGKVFKTGFEAPEWPELIKEAKALGFRPPHKSEPVGAYRTALRGFEPPVQGDIGNLISGLFGSER